MFKFCFLVAGTLLLGSPISVHNQRDIYVMGKKFISTELTLYIMQKNSMKDCGKVKRLVTSCQVLLKDTDNDTMEECF